MNYLASRQHSEVEIMVDDGGYQDFEGLNFKIIEDLPPGQYVELTTDEPTYIKQSTGAIKVTAKAPTIIEGCTGKIAIDGYAPILVRGSTGGMEAHLRANSAIEGMTNYVRIKAASHLELIARGVRDFNGKYNGWGPVHLNAPEGNKGAIFFRGGASSLHFEYESQAGLYLPKDTHRKNLAAKIKTLLS